MRLDPNGTQSTDFVDNERWIDSSTSPSLGMMQNMCVRTCTGVDSYCPRTAEMMYSDDNAITRNKSAVVGWKLFIAARNDIGNKDILF